MKRFLSLGAGVQSSTLALMIARGELPMVDAAIFADTGDEPQEVYRWLEFLRNNVPFPIHTVSAGRLSVESTTLRTSKKSGNTYLRSSIPVFITNTNGQRGMSVRQCTREHKIDPINKLLRKLADVPRGCKEQRVTVLIGISLDEFRRMKPSPHKWIKTEWPLIDARMTRQDCLNWMEANNYPSPPRSACVFCPYKSDAEWRRLKTDHRADFLVAVEYEKLLQSSYEQSTALSGIPFLHASRVPLGDVDFSENASKQVDMFNDECEGMCGV